MPSWFSLPWGPILHGAAALLKQANERRILTEFHPAELTNDLEALRRRVMLLEQQQRTEGELIQQLASQLSAVATAAQASDTRLRQAYAMAIAGVVLVVIALAVALWR